MERLSICILLILKIDSLVGISNIISNYWLKGLFLLIGMNCVKKGGVENKYLSLEIWVFVVNYVF